jgi:hypothetical protein
MINDYTPFQKRENDKLSKYHCPRYDELPQFDVYMEQLIAILEEYLAPFEIPGEEKTITATMVNNYVKQKIIRPPKNKKYSKSHIMYLIVLGILKNVLSISDIATLISMQMHRYPLKKAYNFFAVELENVIKVTFGERDFSEANSARERTNLSKLVRSALLSFANNVYVKKNIYFTQLEQQGKETISEEDV